MARNLLAKGFAVRGFDTRAAAVEELVAAGGEPAADAIRQATAGRGEGVFSVSELEEAVVCRYLGHHADEAKSLFTLAWNVLRAERQGKPAVAPRTWAT